jgi:hypothetical protein
MAGIMSALGNNPAAAQSIFAGADTVTVEICGEDLVVWDRLKYLICDRTWAVDPTNGGSLGSALVAATTVLRDRSGLAMVRFVRVVDRIWGLGTGRGLVLVDLGGGS